jgi:hypothetical protein
VQIVGARASHSHGRLRCTGGHCRRLGLDWQGRLDLDGLDQDRGGSVSGRGQRELQIHHRLANQVGPDRRGTRRMPTLERSIAQPVDDARHAARRPEHQIEGVRR